MKIFQQLLISIILLLSSIRTIAQAPDNIKTTTKSFFAFEFNVLTNSTFAGRQASAAQPYLTPSIAYNNKHGFCIVGSFSYQATRQVIDAYTLSIADTLKLFKGFSINFNAEKSIYNGDSENILSNVGVIFGAGLSYELGPFNFGADGTLNILNDPIIKGPDQFVSFNLGYTYSLGRWSINPNITNLIGTRKSSLINRAKNLDDQFPERTYYYSNPTANSLQILDYEVAFPITYTSSTNGKPWSFSFTPTLAMPVNPLTYSRYFKYTVNGQDKFSVPHDYVTTVKNTWYFNITFTATL